LIYSSRVRLPRTLTPSAPGVHPRPRVLIADDCAEVLEIVASLLAPDFDIVGAASDGQQALDLTLQLDPDVVVLDISMPELDGFQTLRELRRIGSRAKVVLLTLYENDAYVDAAISFGAQGYVLKTGIHSNLVSSIDHALAGRLFVPSLTSLATAGSEHAVQFHTNDGYFLDHVGGFIDGMLRSGELVVVVATEETRTGIDRRLEDRGMNLQAVAAEGRYIALDAAESLSKFMRNGRPDAASLAGMAAELDRTRVATRGPNSRLNLFGEMATILCRNGNIEAVMELEHTWGDLTRQLPFFTVCSYSGALFQDPKSHDLFPRLCTAHRAVSHTFNA
jgi:CheY-like chemotaxis protein